MRNMPVLNKVIATSWLTATLVLAGCGSGNRNDMGANSTDSLTMGGEQAGTLANDSGSMTGAGAQGMGANTPLDDAQIADVAMTANRLDSTSAAMVVDRLTNAEVKSFARRMMTEHGAMMDSIRAVTTRLGATTGTNQISTSLQQMARPTEGTGAALDRTYMDNEVAMHQQVLRTIDEALMPQVRDASLRTLVERMRISVAGHLQDAESIRSQLGTQ